jgi:hypothetical protein
LGAGLVSSAEAYRAKEPSAMPNTSSPTPIVVTSLLIASPRPATSRPRARVFGLRTPQPATRIG